MSNPNDAYDSKLHFLAVTELKEVEAELEKSFSSFENKVELLYRRREELLDRIESLERLKGSHESKN